MDDTGKALFLLMCFALRRMYCMIILIRLKFWGCVTNVRLGFFQNHGI